MPSNLSQYAQKYLLCHDAAKFPPSLSSLEESVDVMHLATDTLLQFDWHRDCVQTQQAVGSGGRTGNIGNQGQHS
jgi:hypothetical protein